MKLPELQSSAILLRATLSLDLASRRRRQAALLRILIGHLLFQPVHFHSSIVSASGGCFVAVLVNLYSISRKVAALGYPAYFKAPTSAWLTLHSRRRS
jgi:hypothetical protein